MAKLPIDKAIEKALESAISGLADYFMKHPEVLTSAAMGAFLTSKVGRSMIKTTLTKLIPQLAKATTRLEAAGIKWTVDAVKTLVSDAAIKAGIKLNPKLTEKALVGSTVNVTNSKGPIEASSGALAVVGAAAVAGQMVGSYLGNTISAFKGYKNAGWLEKATRVMFPAVYTLTDYIEQQMPQSTKQKAIDAFNNASGRNTEFKQLQQRQDSLRAINALKSAEYDTAAKEMKMVDRPKHPQAENEWQKEVERRMKESKKTQKFNDPTWYYKGQADKLIAGTLTWTGVKTNGRGLPLVQFMTFNVDLTLPIVNQLLPTKLVNNYECLFAALRGPNTGAYNYTAEDVYVYDVTIKGLIAKVKFLQKIIKAAHTHDVESDQLAKNLVYGITGSSAAYADIITNGPTLISRLNAISEEINTWPLVGTSLGSRWNYLASKCIKDFNGPKAIYGVYNVVRAPKFSTSSVAHFTGASVFVTDMSTSIAQLETEYNDFKSWAGTLNDKNAMLKVAGDFCKLLGTDPKVFANVDYLNQEQPGALSFEYDKEAQFQLQNAMMAGRRSTTTYPSWDGSQTANYVYATTIFTSGTGSFTNSAINPYKKANKWYVTNDSGVVRSNANNIEMTQFVYNADVLDNAGNETEHNLLDCSVAVLEHCTMFYFSDTNIGGSVSSYTLYPYFNPTVTQGDVSIGALPLIASRQIDFLPTMVYCEGTQNSQAIRGQYIDVDNYATIDGDQLQNYVIVGTYSLTYTYSMEDVELRKKIK